MGPWRIIWASRIFQFSWMFGLFEVLSVLICSNRFCPKKSGKIGKLKSKAPKNSTDGVESWRAFEQNGGIFEKTSLLLINMSRVEHIDKVRPTSSDWPNFTKLGLGGFLGMLKKYWGPFPVSGLFTSGNYYNIIWEWRV